MKTMDQIIETVKSGRESQCLDGRDYGRLIDFVPVEHWNVFGYSPKEGAEVPEIKPFTRDAVIKQLGDDVSFGFDKALNKRGISASLMNEVIKMWMWVLDDELQDHDDYSMYGLPLLKAVALKYGFHNEIGDHDGDEDRYNG